MHDQPMLIDHQKIYLMCFHDYTIRHYQIPNFFQVEFSWLSMKRTRCLFRARTIKLWYIVRIVFSWRKNRWVEHWNVHFNQNLTVLWPVGPNPSGLVRVGGGRESGADRATRTRFAETDERRLLKPMAEASVDLNHIILMRVLYTPLPSDTLTL